MAPKTLEERHEDLRTDLAVLGGKLESLKEERRVQDSALRIARKHRQNAEKENRRIARELNEFKENSEVAIAIAHGALTTCKRADELRYAWHRSPWTSSEVVAARDRLALALRNQYGPVPADQKIRAPGTRAERKRSRAQEAMAV